MSLTFVNSPSSEAVLEGNLQGRILRYRSQQCPLQAKYADFQSGKHLFLFQSGNQLTKCMTVHYLLLQLLNNINFAHILESNCPLVAPKPRKVDGSRTLYETFHVKLDEQLYPFKCRVRPCHLYEFIK